MSIIGFIEVKYLTYGLNNLISNPAFSLKMAVLLSVLFTE